MRQPAQLPRQFDGARPIRDAIARTSALRSAILGRPSGWPWGDEQKASGRLKAAVIVDAAAALAQVGLRRASDLDFTYVE